jgi:hypothetical protein
MKLVGVFVEIFYSNIRYLIYSARGDKRKQIILASDAIKILKYDKIVLTPMLLKRLFSLLNLTSIKS